MLMGQWLLVLELGTDAFVGCHTLEVAYEGGRVPVQFDPFS